MEPSCRPQSIWVPRLTLCMIVFTAVIHPSLYEPFMSNLWSYLSQTKLYRLSSFETIETIAVYTFVEIYYNTMFLCNPLLRFDLRGSKQSPATSPSEGKSNSPRLPRMRLPHKRLGELAIYIVPLLTLDFTLIKKYAGVPVSEIRKSGGYPPIASSISSSFLLPTFHKFSFDSPLQLHRAIPNDAPSSRRLVLELITALFIYDALFFAIHLAFHRIPALAVHHKQHHRHGEINPQVTNQLSVVERLSLVLLANFSLNIINSHVLTRTAFVPLFVYLLVDIHSGLDLGWSYDKILPSGWGAGARKHAAHHRTGGEGYEPFFCWWDHALDAVDLWLRKMRPIE